MIILMNDSYNKHIFRVGDGESGKIRSMVMFMLLINVGLNVGFNLGLILDVGYNWKIV